MSDLDGLLSAIAGDDEWARHQALERLREEGAPLPFIQGLMGRLAEDDPARRLAARMALSTLASVDSASREGARSALEAALQDPDPDVRVLAASALGEAGDPEAGDALIGRLRDPEPNVVAAAADALGALGYGPALPHLEELCETSDLWLRAAAIVAMGRLGDPRAVAPLEGLTGEPGLEGPIMEALGRIGDPAALDALEAVRTADPERALRIAGSILSADPEASPPSWVPAEARRQEDALRRELVAEDDPAIAHLLGLAGGRQAIEALADLLGPPRHSEAALGGLLAAPADVRADVILPRLTGAESRELVALLAVMPPLADREQIAQLLPFLSHGDETIRAAAAEALARAPGNRTLPLLVAELDRGMTAPEVVRAMGALGDVACGALLPLLDDASVDVRTAAAAALARCGGTAVSAEIRAALDREQDGQAFRALLRALGRAAGGAAVERLATSLASSDELETRLAALDGLGLTGDPGAVPTLEEGMGRSRPETLAALQALGDIGGTEVLAALEPVLDHEDTELRRAAARAALTAAVELDEDRVRALTADDDPWVRVFAARILMGRGASDRLRRMADSDPDRDVREEARRLLREAGG